MKIESGQRAEIVIDQEHSHSFDPARMFDWTQVYRVQVKAFDKRGDPGFGMQRRYRRWGWISDRLTSRDRPCTCQLRTLNALTTKAPGAASLDKFTVGCCNAVLDTTIRKLHRVRWVDDDLPRQVTQARRNITGEHARHREDDDVGILDGIGLKGCAGFIAPDPVHQGSGLPPLSDHASRTQLCGLRRPAQYPVHCQPCPCQ